MKHALVAQVPDPPEKEKGNHSSKYSTAQQLLGVAGAGSHV
ncbi:MAG: hypothetical protein ACP5E2_11440 [Terracidiphilus sp.]